MGFSPGPSFLQDATAIHKANNIITIPLKIFFMVTILPAGKRQIFSKSCSPPAGISYDIDE
jgi:hypothetical protein